MQKIMRSESLEAVRERERERERATLKEKWGFVQQSDTHTPVI